jgi:hypothetical protein
MTSTSDLSPAQKESPRRPGLSNTGYMGMLESIENLNNVSATADASQKVLR